MLNEVNKFVYVYDYTLIYNKHLWYQTFSSVNP